MNLSFNGIELSKKTNVIFSNSVFGTLINAELYGSKNIEYFTDLNQLFNDVSVRDVNPIFYNEKEMLMGLQDFRLQIMNGGLEQYFFNKYHTYSNSKPSSLVSFFKNKLLPFVEEIYGKDSDEAKSLRDLSNHLKLLIKCIDENQIDENGKVSGTIFDECGECGGSGTIDFSDSDVDEDELDSDDKLCPECHGNCEVEVDMDVPFDFDTVFLTDDHSDETGMTIEMGIVDNFWPLDEVIELYAEYIFKSVEQVENNNSNELER